LAYIRTAASAVRRLQHGRSRVLNYEEAATRGRSDMILGGDFFCCNFKLRF